VADFSLTEEERMIKDLAHEFADDRFVIPIDAGFEDDESDRDFTFEVIRDTGGLYVRYDDIEAIAFRKNFVLPVFLNQRTDYGFAVNRMDLLVDEFSVFRDSELHAVALHQFTLARIICRHGISLAIGIHHVLPVENSLHNLARNGRSGNGYGSL